MGKGWKRTGFSDNIKTYETRVYYSESDDCVHIDLVDYTEFTNAQPQIRTYQTYSYSGIQCICIPIIEWFGDTVPKSIDKLLNITDDQKAIKYKIRYNNVETMDSVSYTGINQICEDDTASRRVSIMKAYDYDAHAYRDILLAIPTDEISAAQELSDKDETINRLENENYKLKLELTRVKRDLSDKRASAAHNSHELYKITNASFWIRLKILFFGYNKHTFNK